MRVCGIDEAGRGAVLGPLVVAGVCIKDSKQGLFRKLGVKDSKKLSPQRREEIYNALKKSNEAFHTVSISPKQIDKTSLNELEIRASRAIIRALRPQKVFLDVPARGKGIERYCQRVKEGAEHKVKVIGGNKFDEYHLVVAAASIVAKVVRDRKIESLKKKYGDFGSGYPNKRTGEFIKANYELIRPIVRHKWKTIAELGVKN